ncbi:unnamed protein product [Clavelina lepadiformis]|uniref:Uncharacterized protein n=1 Tax=Clavelina lepadiformis TaxID=159417 RepID=A0ABP0FTN9_CLALP
MMKMRVWLALVLVAINFPEAVVTQGCSSHHQHHSGRESATHVRNVGKCVMRLLDSPRCQSACHSDCEPLTNMKSCLVNCLGPQISDFFGGRQGHGRHTRDLAKRMSCLQKCKGHVKCEDDTPKECIHDALCVCASCMKTNANCKGGRRCTNVFACLHECH